MIRPTFVLAIAALGVSVAHAENRQLDAHQHGHGTLNMAFEGNSVAMEFVAPGADIVGFEHAGKSAEDRAIVDAAMAQLANPLELFVFPAGAGCSVTAANVTLDGDEGPHNGHDEHHDDAHEEDHGGEHDQNHNEHGEEGEAERHTEFHAEYELTCADPSAIEAIEFAYFERFPNAAELYIQLSSDKGAKGFEVERDELRLGLSGAI